MDLNELLRMLYQHCGYETLEASQPSKGTVRLMGRVRHERIPDWIIAVHTLLNGEGNGWSLDVSKYHFLRGGKVIYAWRVIIQAEDVLAQLPSIYAVLRSAPKSSRAETDEMPLLGASRSRNVMVKGKGAGPMGSVAVGPALLMKGGV